MGDRGSKEVEQEAKKRAERKAKERERQASASEKPQSCLAQKAETETCMSCHCLGHAWQCQNSVANTDHILQI